MEVPARAREAMDFYQSVLGGDRSVMTFGDKCGISWMVNVAGAAQS